MTRFSIIDNFALKCSCNYNAIISNYTMSHNKIFSEVKIAIVDDHDLLREGLNAVLSNHGATGIGKYGTATSLLEALDSGEEYDLFIIDIELPDMDGFELIGLVRKRNPKARIMVSTVHDEIWTLRKLMAKEVDAIVYKTCDGKEIVKALEEILSGERYYCEAVSKVIGEAADTSRHPTERELEVLGQIAEGKTSREIAASMYVTENTVEAHRKALFNKLGAVNAADLIVKAIERGYLKKFY